MKITQKLLEIQKSIDKLVKDSKNESDKYAYVSGEKVLEVVRPKLNELSLLVIPKITASRVTEGATRSGTSRYFTEIEMIMTIIDAESLETLDVPWYAQGVDLAGEKGVGKALTYAEKYFFLKLFHVPTQKDDPDSDSRTGTGEKRQRGTQAEKETIDFQRQGIEFMLNVLCAEETPEKTAEKISKNLVALTENTSRGYAGVSSVADLSDLQVPVVYGKVSRVYENKTHQKYTGGK